MDKSGTRSFSDGGCYTPQYSAYPCESNVFFVMGIAAARKIDLRFFLFNVWIPCPKRGFQNQNDIV